MHTLVRKFIGFSQIKTSDTVLLCHRIGGFEGSHKEIQHRTGSSKPGQAVFGKTQAVSAFPAALRVLPLPVLAVPEHILNVALCFPAQLPICFSGVGQMPVFLMVI